MFEIRGKYNTAKIFTDQADEDSIAQVIQVCSQKFTEGSRIRMMPDIHAGAGCTIGTTMTIQDKVAPNLVGVDIGCGMEMIQLREKHIELQKLDKLIRQKIPAGFQIREETHPFFDEIELEELCCFSHINPLRAEKAWERWAAATISSRSTRTRRGMSTSSSIPAAGIWGWRSPSITRKRAGRR